VKILVFEYITGGGLNKQELPDSLAKEGRMMLQALLDNLSLLSNIKVELLLDWRFFGKLDTHMMNVFLIHPHHDFSTQYKQLAQTCDAVWPIAPESDGILQNLCKIAEQYGCKLLTSSSSAVAITANKLTTYQILHQNHIATVPTQLFNPSMSYPDDLWMLKPIDGVGCADSFLCSGQNGFKQLAEQVDYIIQPHIEGKKTSLSCLFKEGKVWLLSANLQHFTIANNQYHLAAVTVNCANTESYQSLASDIGRTFPDLWGYVGIDLIETPEQILVLEINPRLTSSFVGIRAALGLNVAELVLSLINNEPNITMPYNHAITINLNKSACPVTA